MNFDQLGALARYRELRDRCTRAMKLLIRDADLPLMAAGSELGMLQDGRLVFGSESEIDLLGDYCVYQPTKRYANFPARWLAERRQELDSDLLSALAAMAASLYSIFEVVEVSPGFGLSMRNLIGGREHRVVDRNMSKSVGPGFVTGMRLITLEGITFGSGGGLPALPWYVDDLRARLSRRVAQRLDEPDFVLGPHEQALLNRMAIMMAIKANITSRVNYA